MKKRQMRHEREEWKRQEYRRLILKAAEQVIVRKGTTAMTMDDVAREAEFSKATLYHYYRSKGELILEILANFFEETDEEVRRIRALDSSAKEKLRQGIHFYLQFNQEKENISRMLIMDHSFMEKMRIFVADKNKLTSDLDRRFLARMKTRRREILDNVAGILREGVETGEFRKMDIPDAVTFLESVLQGYCHVRFWHERPRTVKEAKDLIYAFFLQGIERKEGFAKGESR